VGYTYDRRSIVARDFPTQEALKEYLKNHPDADRTLHHVEKAEAKDDKPRDPREYARERAKHAPPKKSEPFVGMPGSAHAAMVARVVARYLMAHEDATGAGTSRGWEHRKEKEEAIERNIEAISPHLKSLWRKMRHQFKGTPESRTEQFLLYVHDHPGEDMALLQDEADRDLAKMIKELENRDWRPHSPSYFQPSPQWEPAEDPIPFA
jgi:hypothetical protein